MKVYRTILLGFLAPIGLVSLAGAAAVAADGAKAACEKLASVKLADTALKASFISSKDELSALAKNVGANPASAASALPFCRIEATITPAAGAEIKSEVWLPSAEKWNKRFVGVGVGGSAGAYDRNELAAGVALGYATAISDAGSHSNSILAMTFGRNPEWRTNRAYRGVHLTAVTAKQMVQNFYQSAPVASLFMGCSGGGYEAMGELQRYPDDYDGILAGDPALHWEKIGLWQGMAYVATNKDPAAQIPASKLAVINQAALNTCDALDGVKDGVIDDPRKCKVDFKALQCKSATGDQCFSAPQIAALEKIYAPFHHPRTNAFLFPGFNFGAEMAPAARTRLTGEAGGSSISSDQPGPLVWSFPEKFTAKDWLSFDFDQGTDAAIKAFSPYANSDPDLSNFKRSGGKVIMYTGWADPNLHPETLVNYYTAMTKAVGGESEANSFARLFMVPGMYHCRGGVGPNIFGQALANAFDANTDASNNMLLALDRWVVEGVAPERVVAKKFVDDDARKGIARTRPLCAYPKVARWSGKGSTDDAANFTCVAP